MKYLFVLMTIACLSGFSNCADASFELLNKSDSLIFINDYPIKIDGGASFFTFASTSLNSKKFILIISKDKQAFIQTAKGFIYFKYQKREITERGYQDTYSNEHTQLTVNITKIRKTGNYNSIRSGTLELKGAQTSWFKIHGNVEEYNK